MNLKPRVIVQTDISSPDNEPDDIQSFVHLLSLADQYEIEGIVATTGYALLGSYNVDSQVNGVNFRAAPKVGVLNDLPGGDRMEFSDNVATEGSTELGGNVPPFSRLTGEYETLLRSGYTNEGLSTEASSSRMSLRVRNLEPGRKYEVQFWVNDHRVDVLGHEGNELFTTIADGSSNVQVQHNAAGALGSPGHVVTGTFTAGIDAGRQKMITFTGGTNQPGDGSVADVVSTVNAYQIRDVTDDPSVPDAEPGAPTVWSEPAVIAADEDVSLRGEGLRAVNFTRDYPQYRFVLPPEPENIYRILDAYEKDLPNLMRRSGQTGFMEDESQPQAVGYWPSADYLRERVTVGQRMRGFKEFGDGQSTAGSEQTIAVVDEDDDRPVWIHFWGSGNTFAQSVWDVQDQRTPDEVKEFLSKVRIYAIGDQDCRNTPLEDAPCWDASTLHWVRTNYQDDLIYIWANNYRYYMNLMRDAWPVYAPIVQASGNLGPEYANPVYGIEGDTPAFLHHLPGMNDPSDPTQSGYGGQFELRTNPDGTVSYRNDGDVAPTNNAAVDLTFEDQLNDFVSRMQWADTGSGNRNPRVTLNGDTTYDIVMIDAEVGQDVTLSAAGTTDPEDDALTYQWRVDEAPGYDGDITFDTSQEGQARFRVPADADGQDIHVLLRVTDDGTPALSSWRRAVIAVEETPSTTEEVTPAAVTFSDEDGTADDTFTIPAVEGVEYVVDSEVVPAGTYPGSGTVTVTARALDGFVLAEGAVAEWSHTFSTAGEEPGPDGRGAEFHLSNSWRAGTDVYFMYGRWADEVLIGDWDGNGTDTIAVRRGNEFHVSNAQRGGEADVVFTYGRPDDVVLVGDWNGSGTDTLAVRRGATYHVKNSLRGGPADSVFRYGRDADMVLVGDWDGNGTDTFAVRREATYYVKNSLRGGDADSVFTYGRATDVTHAGDWNGDGTDTFALQRGRVFYVNNSLRGGDADTVVSFGRIGDEVHVGDWNGDGTDTLGIRRPVGGHTTTAGGTANIAAGKEVMSGAKSG